MDSTKTTLTGISFCTGARGLEIGLERSGVNVRELAYVEIEAFVIANLVAAMEKGFLAPTPIWSNLKSFNPESFRGMVDIFTAGYPCQPFSLAGKRKGEEDPRHLWPYIDNAIDVIRPGICFFENVAAHLTLGYETVRGRLQELDYHVEEGIYAAQEVGAPHRRERLFILAVKHGYDLNGVLLEHTYNAGGGTSGYGIDSYRTQKDERREELTLNRTSGSSDAGSGVGDMADPYNDGRTWECRDIQSESKAPEGTQQWQEREETLRERSWAEPEPISTDVADSISEGLQGHRRHEHGEGRTGIGENRPIPACSVSPSGVGQKANSYDGGSRENREPSELRADSPEQPPIDCRESDPRESTERQSRDRWPARPGEEQYDWEEPRTLTKKAESEVGLTVDGYGFREDLLRLAGNAVVPQQAEYAFRDLIRKHKEHNERK